MSSKIFLCSLYNYLCLSCSVYNYIIFSAFFPLELQTLGNHDFDYGPDVTAEYIKQLHHPVVSGNLNANGHYIGNHVKKHVIVDINGHKVGICGSTTQVVNRAPNLSAK